MKPDPEFFKNLLDNEKINPAESLFVDDGPRNIESACRLGFNTLCPVNGSDWRTELYAALG